LILLTDANILITLYDVDGVAVLPRIAPTEVLDVVLGECEHDSQPGIWDAVITAGIEIVPSEMTWAGPARQMMNGKLSFPDALCLFYAKNQGKILLSGDRPLRNRCEEEGVEYRGAIWVVQEAYDRGLMPAEELCRWIKTWPLMERRLPKEELDRLKKNLNC
jgi:predicted nucleic acid-binding protein